MDGPQNTSPLPEGPSWQFKPGETISPRAAQSPASAAPAEQPAPIAAPEAPAPTSSATPEPATPPSSAPAPKETTTATPGPAASPPSVEQPASVAVPDQPADQPSSTPMSDDSLVWTASEFIAHHKTAGWHMLLVAAAIVLALAVWFVTHDIISVLVVVVAGAVLSFYGGRQPQQLQYGLSQNGLDVGPKHYDFSNFRAFSIVPEGAFSSIELVPSRRFAPPMTIYYDPQDEDRILDIMGMHLPQQEWHGDAVGALMRRIRF